MLGWEFPPYFAGGVGMVCAELCKALHDEGVEVLYTMPKGPNIGFANGARLFIANNLLDDEAIKFVHVDSLLHAYASEDSYDVLLNQAALNFGNSTGTTGKLYGADLWAEVHRFAEKIRIIAKRIADTEGFDVIHAHDHWTFPAGVAAKYITGKPLIVHVHITEFDKSGGQGYDKRVYDMERYGMLNADAVVAVSEFTKQRLIHNYGIPAQKIRVIHNAGITMEDGVNKTLSIKENERIVLFTGRITLQKGPEYFVHAAKIVADHDPNVRFIMAGSGDKMGAMIELVAQLKLSDRFHFTGFYNREQAEQLFGAADVFVMPSVSEPFGVVPLEAMIKDTPCIISKQSGVSEVLNHCIKTDFWDVRGIAEHILAILKYRALHNELKHHGALEVKNLTWDVPARKCIALYGELLGGAK